MSNLPPTNPIPPQSQQSGNNPVLIVLLVLGGVFVVGALVCGGLVFVMYSRVQTAVIQAEQLALGQADASRLQSVGLALHNYEAAYKRFPSPYAVNEDNEPVWSWRVPMTPFMEQFSLWEEVMNETGSMGMQNWREYSALNGPCPDVFRSIDSNAPANHSNVFLISADPPPSQTSPAFRNGEYIRFSSILDGTSNTLMALQFKKHSAPWADPATLTPDEAFTLLQNEDGECNALLFDGSVIVLRNDISRENFDALVSGQGGEIVNFDELTRQNDGL